jgi:hypothetical protein
MRFIRLAVGLSLFFFCLVAPNVSHADKADKLTVVGKLSRVMAIGGETSGWSIELDPPLTVNGKQVSSIEVVYIDSKKLESLANKTVKASGTLSNVTGIETGQRPVLNLNSIKAVKEKPPKSN